MNLSPSEAAAQSRSGFCVFLTLLAILFVCGLHSACVKSVTHDEIWHLPIGLLHWRSGEFDQDVLNPPLTRMWSAIPAALAGVEVNAGRDATDVALQFVQEHDDYRTWYIWGRAFNLICSLLTACILYRWAGDWFGRTAAMIAVALFCTCPNVIAHSSLVTPDAGLMLGFTAVLRLFTRWRDAPSRRTAVGLGIVLGLVQTTKFTAVLLYPLLGLLWLVVPARRTHGLSRGASCLHAGAALLSSLLVWNALFLFHGTGRPLASYELQSETLKSLQSIGGPLANLPLPLPVDYLAGVDRQKWVMEQSHPIFLDGVWSVVGFRDYFLRTLQYKLPHVFQAAVLIGGALLVFARGDSSRLGRLSILVIPTGVLLGIASFSSMQLGVRYVLPVLPLLVLLAARLGPCLDSWRPVGRRVALTVLTAGALVSLRHHPHHLAYFNEAAGGPIGGREHLLDSNLDWGQDLYLVREFMQANGLNEIGLVYFGTLPAERLGIRFHIPRGRAPEPGWHAVSVNYVMGRPHLLRAPDGTGRAADVLEFAYFQRFEPVARLGYSIDVYHIRDATSTQPR